MPDYYTPSDPTLARLDHGLAELRVDGDVRAYLACVVTRLGARGDGGPWPWFVVVWPDGYKEDPEEDYGPGWEIVRELDAGVFTYGARPSLERRKTVLGMTTMTCRERCLDEIQYDVRWLEPAEAAATWARLGLEDSDF